MRHKVEHECIAEGRRCAGEHCTVAQQHTAGSGLGDTPAFRPLVEGWPRQVAIASLVVDRRSACPHVRLAAG